MQRRASWKVGVGAATVALVLAATLVGEAFAGGGGIPEPQVIELVTRGCSTDDNDPQTECRVYRLKDTDGERSGDIFRFKVPLQDTDGNAVGQFFLECIGARKTGQTCTGILSLKPGPFTERGTIVSTGTSLPPAAITGGSGAYLNVRGDITGDDQNDGFHLFVNLIP